MARMDFCQRQIRLGQQEILKGNFSVRVSCPCFVPGLAANILSAEQKLDEVLRWLAPLYCTGKHNDTHKLGQESTRTWFPSTDAYKKWRVGGNQFLWLHGEGAVSDIS